MDIEKHFELLLDKYELKLLYKKYIFLSMLTTFINESFYWLLLYFSEIVKQKPEIIKKLAGILIIIIALHTPVERLFNATKSELFEKIKLANTNYFNNIILKINKYELLTFDLVKYYNILEHFNENIEQYLLNIKTKYDIPIRGTTLIIIALNKKFSLLIGLFAVFFAVIKVLNEWKLIEEHKLTQKHFKYDNDIRNYIINSKNLLINDEFNNEYLTKNLCKFEKVNKEIIELNHKLDMNVNITMFIFISLVLINRLEELNQFDFFYYFLIIYDVEFIGDKVNEFYKNRIYYTKMQERLTYLKSFSPMNLNNQTIKPFNRIVINKIVNEKPKLKNNNPIIINQNDHILIDGKSGSGKTSLLYTFKGILQPDVLEMEPNIESIIPQTYLTLPNHKNLYNGKLYDIITNFEENPNIQLINFALETSAINHKLNKNEFIDIETLSSGERVRLLIARIIYTVKNKNYNILLFDEIDENLNDNLAVDICTKLRNIFNNKIIIYITHNESVKKIFDKHIYVENGNIL
jgi:ABC-type lipoprotein export system ATPase subunit